MYLNSKERYNAKIEHTIVFSGQVCNAKRKAKISWLLCLAHSIDVDAVVYCNRNPFGNVTHRIWLQQSDNGAVPVLVDHYDRQDALLAD